MPSFHQSTYKKLFLNILFYAFLRSKFTSGEGDNKTLTPIAENADATTNVAVFGPQRAKSFCTWNDGVNALFTLVSLIVIASAMGK